MGEIDAEKKKTENLIVIYGCVHLKNKLVIEM